MKYDIREQRVRLKEDGEPYVQDEEAAERMEDEGWERYMTLQRDDHLLHRFRRPSDYESQSEEETEE